MTDIYAPSERAEPTLAEKVEFLSDAKTHGVPANDIVALETHMSWVFLVGKKVFKLKKPVRFPYLDFSTLDRRHAACMAELALNRRLAASVYVDVAPLSWTGTRLVAGGGGKVVDWLVVMRRLDRQKMLDQLIERSQVSSTQLDRLSQVLVRFYRNAERRFVTPSIHHLEWEKNVALNHRVLLDRRLGLPVGLIWRIDRVQRRFLAVGRELLARRVLKRWILDGHGDLRPEHIWLGDPPQIIDCLEFNARLRAVDPFDEVAYLSIECERLGAPWVGERITRDMVRALHDGLPPELFSFYRCYRASLRARLAIAHLLEPQPRTPEKWPRLAREYLHIAEREAVRLASLLSTPRGRLVRARFAGGGSSPQRALPKRG